jgi:hypothetical protein
VPSRNELTSPTHQAIEPIWVKSKCLNREEFVVVGWTDPEGSRSHIGALLLGYFTEDGRLHYAGRAGTGITEKELKRLAGVLSPQPQLTSAYGPKLTFARQERMSAFEGKADMNAAAPSLQLMTLSGLCTRGAWAGPS